MAATTGGLTSLFFVRDRLSIRNFLVDTGAEISVLPPTGIERRNTQGPVFLAANGSNIKTYGKRAVTLDLPPGRFQWNFVSADVTRPILGADFLRANSLFVDMKHQRLVNAESFTSIPLRKTTIPPVGINAISLYSNTYAKLLSLCILTPTLYSNTYAKCKIVGRVSENNYSSIF